MTMIEPEPCLTGHGREDGHAAAEPHQSRARLATRKRWRHWRSPSTKFQTETTTGPSRGQGLVRVVRLMLAHGRVVVMMRQGRQEATQCPLRTGSMVRRPG